MPGFKYAEKDRRDAPVSRSPRVEQEKPRVCPDGTGVLCGDALSSRYNFLSCKGGTLRPGCTASLVSMFRTMACAVGREGGGGSS